VRSILFSLGRYQLELANTLAFRELSVWSRRRNPISPRYFIFRLARHPPPSSQRRRTSKCVNKVGSKVFDIETLPRAQ